MKIVATALPAPGGSHNSAAGLRMYFDGARNSSQFGRRDALTTACPEPSTCE